jgi:osmotically-inducible protein OsmY
VENAVVTLEGEVATNSEKRLAGQIALLVPGCQGAVNALAVQPSARRMP